ncbi:MAG: glycoside hydrolase family 97 protein, partial [Panacibacter sp.]
MKLLSMLACTACLITATPLPAQKNIRVTSPDGNIVFSFKLVNKSPVYSVTYKNKTIIDYSSLSLEFDNGRFENNIRINKPAFRDTTEDYELLWGKTKNVHTQYHEALLPLEETVTPFRKINIVVKIFNDGLAFRYEFPQQQKWSAISLLQENTTFNLTGDPTVHTLMLPNYTSSHEGLYSDTPLSNIPSDTLMDMPTLFEFPGNIYMSITEAALLDYAGMYLLKHDHLLMSKLSPLPGQTSIKVKATLPHKSPWRVIFISDRIGALIESNIITTLNEPSKIKDVSWIKPGKTTFPWWNGNVTPDTLNAPGNNFVTNQYYIDFCARNGLEYHSVVEYGLHQWYMDDGVNFQPGPHADVTTPVPGLDMKEICDYAAKLGVGIRVWVQWAALYPKLDTAFALFEKWGLKGMMIDFMDRDDQEMVNIQTEMLEKAAKHHLHIQFHGAYKPTGINRTYPNEFTREGTLNYEADKWNPEGISPDHDLDIIFTRMLAGSTDYHLGGFRAVPKSQFKTQYTRPLMLGTRCHMLAMYVVLENCLQMVCDYPAAYEGQDGFEFIKAIPTTWDETKVIDAKVGEYVTIAREKDKAWYVGTISNNTAREISVPLSFLEEGNYKAEVYTDAPDANENPNHLLKQTKAVTNKDVLNLKIAAGGGEVMILKK